MWWSHRSSILTMHRTGCGRGAGRGVGRTGTPYCRVSATHARHAVRPVSTTVKWSASRAARALFTSIYKLYSSQIPFQIQNVVQCLHSDKLVLLRCTNSLLTLWTFDDTVQRTMLWEKITFSWHRLSFPATYVPLSPRGPGAGFNAPLCVYSSFVGKVDPCF